MLDVPAEPDSVPQSRRRARDLGQLRRREYGAAWQSDEVTGDPADENHLLEPALRHIVGLLARAEKAYALGSNDDLDLVVRSGRGIRRGADRQPARAAEECLFPL